MLRPVMICFAFAVLATTVRADTIHVYSGESIQAAISGADSGDEIIIHPGTYTELINFSGKAIALRSSDGPEVTTIEGAGIGPVVTCSNGEGPDTILEGFTITGGMAFNGGGMYVHQADPVVIGCTFLSNTAGVPIPVLDACGGGLYLYESNATVISCAFLGNSAVVDIAAAAVTAWGGGLHVIGGSPTVTNSVFSGNSVSATTISGPNFTANSYGGGIGNDGGNLSVTNCTFSGNSAAASPTLLARGGGLFGSGGTTTVTNCVFYANTATVLSPDLFGATTVSHSCLQFPDDGTGNIVADPLLVRANGPDNVYGTADDDMHLTSGSPCVDAGDNSAAGDILTDLDGHPRFMDDPHTPDTGAGEPPFVDMGAYEYLRDCNDNGVQDAVEIVERDCNTNGELDDCELQLTYADAPGLAIPDDDFQGVTSVIHVPHDVTILDLEVALRVDHPFVFDLTVALSKGPTTVYLVSNMGWAPPYVCGMDNLNVVLDDEGTGGPIQDLCTVAMSSPPNYTPHQPLSAFDGLSAAGDWTLTVKDTYGGEVGTLVSWGLSFIAVADCNTNGVLDECDIAQGTSGDCNTNGIPDECDIAQDTSEDCNTNGTPDECDIAQGTSGDCNANGLPDDCELQGWTYAVAPMLAIPDSDSTGVMSVIHVGRDVTIRDLDVALQVSHSQVGDLMIALFRYPSPAQSHLVQRMGFPALGAYGCEENDLNVVLDDEGLGGPIEDLCAPAMNSPPNYTPHDALSVFDGQSAAGDWTLWVLDVAWPQGRGGLMSWGLTVRSAVDCNTNNVPDECDIIVPGDFDADEEADLDDWRAFADSLAGPGVPPQVPASDCFIAYLAAFDFDGDGDADLDDFAVFQRLFSGS